MPRYFFDINGKVDDIGVDLADDEAAIIDATRTVAKLAEYDAPPDDHDRWICIVRNPQGETIHQVAS